ncbi:MAG: hypothetical protein VKJ27_09765 [Synechocystis sp.]|nr:hypothetical protein [Synechocystis sp.]
MTRLGTSSGQDLQELSIVLAATNHQPSMLTPDFLAGSGIIPTDWTLAKPFTTSQRSSQMAFTNGVKITGKLGNITFAEGIAKKALEDLEIPSLARQYAAMLPNLDYRGVGINPRWFITFDGQPDAAQRFISQQILADRPWQSFGLSPLQAGINLVYTLDRCQLHLAINKAVLKLPDRDIPAVMFAGNFSYGIPGDTPQARLDAINQAIGHWQDDLAVYGDLIDQQFLAGMEREAVSLFPVASV